MPPSSLPNCVARQFAAFFVVGGAEGRIIRAVQRRVDDDDRDFMRGGIVHGRHERLVVQRGQDDAGDLLGDECLDDVDLPVAVAFAFGAFPENVDRLCPVSPGPAWAFNAPGMNGLPVFMGRAFRNDRDLQGPAPAARRRSAAGAGGRVRRRCAGRSPQAVRPDPTAARPNLLFCAVLLCNVFAHLFLCSLCVRHGNRVASSVAGSTQLSAASYPASASWPTFS